MVEVETRKIRRAALEMLNGAMQSVADTVLAELKSYALAHKRTGLLHKNIKLTRRMRGNGTVYYVIDGGDRSNYGGKSYHPVTFFRTDSGKRSLTDTLRRARQNLN